MEVPKSKRRKQQLQEGAKYRARANIVVALYKHRQRAREAEEAWVFKLLREKSIMSLLASPPPMAVVVPVPLYITTYY